MRRRPLKLVFVGLSLSSCWGNGHATTYRSLLRGLAALGHRVTFLERNVPWYADNRDLPVADFCTLALYDSLEELEHRHGVTIEEADAVIVGSYVPAGTAVIDLVRRLANGLVCFYDIDTPVTLDKIERGDEEYLTARQIPLFDAYFSFTGGPTLRRLHHEFGAKRPLALYCSVDETVYRPLDEPAQWDLGYLGTYSSDRQPALERLLLEPARRLPDRRFVVAGSQYPSDIAWPVNVERIDHVPAAEHASFYGRQRFTLNLTRSAMAACGWSPSVRLFEAGACAAAVVTDPWPGLKPILGTEEAVFVASGTDEVVAILTTCDEASRRKTGLALHERILAGHTGLVRARQLTGALHTARAAHRRAGYQDRHFTVGGAMMR